jgi:hypothetical protein
MKCQLSVEAAELAIGRTPLSRVLKVTLLRNYGYISFSFSIDNLIIWKWG